MMESPTFSRTKTEKVRDSRKRQSQNRCVAQWVSHLPDGFAQKKKQIPRYAWNDRAGWLAPLEVVSEAGGPLSGGVKDAKDFDGVCADSIGNDVGCIANDQLART
jgi:hypothetical protein